MSPGQVIVGFSVSFTVTSNGPSITEIANIKHNTSDSSFDSLIQVDSDTYAFAYAGLNSGGYIKTFSLQLDGILPVELTSFKLL